VADAPAPAKPIGEAGSESASYDMPASVPLPKLPPLGDGGGLTVDLWFNLPSDQAGQGLVDAMDGRGRGFNVATDRHKDFRFIMGDGNAEAVTFTDPGTVMPNRLQHLVIIVDGGPKIITFIVDGRLCDGAQALPCGWVRFDPHYLDVGGEGPIHLAPGGPGRLKSLRIYNRALRTSEAVGNYQAGLQ